MAAALLPDHQETELGDDATIMLLERRPSRSKALSSQALAQWGGATAVSTGRAR